MIKKYLFLFILISSSFLGHGQETKTIKQKNKKYNEVEIYDVLKSNKHVKHGQYRLKWNWKLYGSIKTEGQYVMGKKQGKWIYHHSYTGRYGKNPRPEYIVYYHDNVPNGTYTRLSIEGDTLETGNYLKGKRHGEWKAYQSDTLMEHYDFSLQQNLLKTKKESNPDISPKLIDGLDISRYIYRAVNLDAPHKDSSAVKLGRIHVRFTVDTDSTVKSLELLKYSDKLIGTAFSKCIENTKWEPALKNGKLVASKTTMMIIYNIEWQGHGKNWLFNIKHYLPGYYIFKIADPL